jgi:hypothetical protein
MRNIWASHNHLGHNSAVKKNENQIENKALKVHYLETKNRLHIKKTPVANKHAKATMPILIGFSEVFPLQLLHAGRWLQYLKQHEP